MRQAVVLLLMMLTQTAFAQRVKTVKGEYTYHAPENVTIEQARRIALERAKIQALADEYGTIVQQQNITRVENSNGESTTDFFSVGGSEVKGEWLGDEDEPEYEIRYEDNMLVVTCRVKGKARELVSANSEFFAGDDLYLSFLSPVKGYVAVYLIDADRQAYCLLPYRSQSEGAYAIKDDQRYVFFSAKDVPQQERAFVDEYNMTCDKDEEHNLIYVVFSPNEFTKAVDRASDSETLPRQLSHKELQEWLAKCRKYDKEMNVQSFPMTIKKK